MTATITEAEIANVLQYDPSTGLFLRKDCVGAGWTSGYSHSAGYKIISFGRTKIYAHRLAWLIYFGHWPPEEVDHINGDKSDNRLSNLRLATRAENCRNVGIKSHNKIGRKGVTRVGHKFRAEIRINKKRHHLGYFDSPDKAAQVYAEASLRLHGQFANGGRARMDEASNSSAIGRGCD